MTGPKVTLATEEGIALPRAAELIAELTREHGAKYTLILTRAVEAANHNDQALYRIRLNSAIDTLPLSDGGRAANKRPAISHVGLFLGAISADLQMNRRA